MRTPLPPREPNPRQIVDFPFHEPISTITPFPVHSRASSYSASPSSSESQPGTSLISSLTGAKSDMASRTLGDQQAGDVHDDDPGEEAAEHVRRGEPAGRAAGDVAPDLDDDLERRTRSGCEEHDAEEVARDEAAEPGAEDRGRTGHQRERGQPLPPHRAPLCERRGDPEPLGDVVDHEADDEEGPERELTERERRPDRQAFAEVVEADPDCDERRQREPADARAAARTLAEPPRDRREEQEAERDAEQHQPGAAECTRERRL